MALPPPCLPRPHPPSSSYLVVGLATHLKLLHPLHVSYCCQHCLAEAGLLTASLCCCRVGSIQDDSQGCLRWVWGSREVECVSTSPGCPTSCWDCNCEVGRGAGSTELWGDVWSGSLPWLSRADVSKFVPESVLILQLCCSEWHGGWLSLLEG